MNGYSEFRIGGTGARAAQPVRGMDLAQVPFGMRSAGQTFAFTFMRHMYEYGTTSEQVAHVKVAHSKHASQNPKAIQTERVTVQDVVGSDRKSTRLNSSHLVISYAVFCLKKKK